MIALPFLANAQRVNIDSLLHEASNTKNDSIRLVQLKTITRSYAELMLFDLEDFNRLLSTPGFIDGKWKSRSQTIMLKRVSFL